MRIDWKRGALLAAAAVAVSMAAISRLAEEFARDNAPLGLNQQSQ